MDYQKNGFNAHPDIVEDLCDCGIRFVETCPQVAGSRINEVTSVINPYDFISGVG